MHDASGLKQGLVAAKTSSFFEIGYIYSDVVVVADESVFSLYTSTGVERATAFCVPNTSFMNEENIWSYVDKVSGIIF